MDYDSFENLSLQIQKAYDAKDLDAVVGYYHPEITLIGPSFERPVCGIEELKAVLKNHFKSPQRTTIRLSDFIIRNITDDVCAVLCRIEGYQAIYYSRYDFKGWLSRTFIETADGPRIISEHLTLDK